ncbi:MAG: tetratricopeptide repeat protein, partial [Pyrinomonadaceae bacterium]|nr:tetratricopeptide repeat protein [Pyrinomonadaceae bacterium]
MTFARREEAYRANNLGVALLEQYNAKEAAASFSRALEIDSNLTIARLNLSIALYYLSDSPGAAREAQKVAAQIPEGPHPHYMLGLVARAQNRIDDALAEFQKVLAIDPNDAATNVDVGQLYVQQKKYSEAVAAFRTAIRAEPYNETALYNLGLLLTRTGAKEEGQQLIQRFQRFRQSGAGRSLGTNYLEQGRYAEAIVSTGAEPELLDRVTPDVKFVDATAAMLPAPADPRASGRLASPEHTLGLILKPGDMSDPTRIDLIKHEIAARLGGNLAPLDYDGDGDLDLFVVSPTSQRLYRNNVGRFIDV